MQKRLRFCAKSGKLIIKKQRGERMYLYLPEAHSDMVWAAVGSVWGAIALWTAVMSLITFFVFGLDKWKARRRESNAKIRRIPERTLFLLAALGGSVGALLGMKVWRHKTLHNSFRFGIPAILTTQILLLAGGYWYFAIR